MTSEEKKAGADIATADKTKENQTGEDGGKAKSDGVCCLHGLSPPRFLLFAVSDTTLCSATLQASTNIEALEAKRLLLAKEISEFGKPQQPVDYSVRQLSKLEEMPALVKYINVEKEFAAKFPGESLCCLLC
jgi:hypothetical protein